MKKILGAFLFFYSLFLQAGEIRYFSCDPGQFDLVHVFALRGLYHVDQNNELRAEIDLSWKNRGRESSWQSEGDLQLVGDLAVLPAGKFAHNEVVALKLRSVAGKNGKVIRSNLLVNFNNPLSSRLTLDNGNSYRARCWSE